MKKLFLPLFWKFSIALIFIVVVFGSVNIYFIRHSVYKTFEYELLKNGTSIARMIGDMAIQPLLYNDVASLNELVSNEKQTDSDLAYILILDGKGHVIAQTFFQAVPKKLITANVLKQGEKRSTALIQYTNNPNDLVKDIAVPILSANIGVVRVGFFEKGYQKEVMRTTRIFLWMIFIFLVIGITGAFIFSYIITQPIKTISTTASRLDLEDLGVDKADKIQFQNRFVLWLKKVIRVDDEMDTLIYTFNEMIRRLAFAYKELQSAQESLLQSKKMVSIGTIAAGLAHEINNPIAGLRNSLRLISERPERYLNNQEYISMMKEAITKIEKVVNGVLNFSRKHEFVKAPVDMEAIIEDTLMLAAFHLEQSGVSITKNFPGNIPPVMGSANHLEQVILNIILNSIDAIRERKSSEPGVAGQIVFTIQISDSELFLEISDNGIGIEPDMLNLIFDPFFTMKKIRQGTGLGLSISYNIIKEHGGDIVAKNRSGGGMIILIKFPLVK